MPELARPAPPDLEFDFPPCSLCRESRWMGCDGGSFWCEKCGCSWDLEGKNGQFEEETH